MTTQPKALALADALDEKPDSDGHCRQAAALLRTQHAAIERKDALLRQALEVLESSRVFAMSREKLKHPEGTEWYDEAIAAITKELQ